MAQNNVYQMVTDRIIEMMQQGRIPWQKPWHYGAIDDGQELAISYTSRRAYSLLNQWLLGEPGEYLTFNQVKERKGRIRSTEGDLLLSCFVEESDAIAAAETAIGEVLDLTKTHNKSIRIQ